MIPDAERRALLAAARRAIAASLGLEPLPVETGEAAPYPAAAFVTLHARGALRGCIGHIEADRPLIEVVASCAVAAARDDHRFKGVAPQELSLLDIEISVLGEMEPVDRLEQIEVGRHGLLVERDVRRGLLLPQVAVEWGWDVPTFVAQTCRKAGLPEDAWPSSAMLYRFTAEVFRENV